VGAGLQVDFPTFAALYADIFCPMQPMIAQQQLLHSRGVPTYLLSNCSGMHIEDVRRRHPFFSSFTGLCLSYEVRAALAAHLACGVDGSGAGVAGTKSMLGRTTTLHTAEHRTAAYRKAMHRSMPLLLLHLQIKSFKPDREIYAATEDITQLAGGDLVFIDDRSENAAAAAARGWHAIHHTSPEETLRQLDGLGLPVVEL
jgi:hypothetical protein